MNIIANPQGQAAEKALSTIGGEDTDVKKSNHFAVVLEEE